MMNLQAVQERVELIRAGREAEFASLAEGVYSGVISDAEEVARQLDRLGKSTVELDAKVKAMLAAEARAVMANQLPGLQAKVELLTAELKANHEQFVRDQHRFEAERFRIDGEIARLRPQVEEALGAVAG